MDPLAPFDDDLVADAAGEAGLGPEAVASALRTHQESVREYPGVDDLVYEWRRGMAYDPLVTRGDAAYYLAVLGHVWTEFGERLDFGDDLLASVRRVHERQARRDAPAQDVDPSVYEEAAPVVLTRH